MDAQRGWIVIPGLLAIGCADLEPRTETASSPLIGGTLATANEFPTVVALEQGPGNWFCTGTLIDKDWVLTAAHCVEGETAAGLNIRFDDANVNDTTGGKVVGVSEIHANQAYDGIAWDNDIALVRLKTSVTDREPTPIHRPTLAPASQTIEVGFGDADDNGGGAGILRKLKAPTLDCATANDPEIDAANVICFDPTDGNGSCYGDSGGPAFVELAGVVNGKLAVAGITSGGTVDSCIAGVDIYTAVAGELAFIDATLKTAPSPDPDPDPSPDPGGSGGGSTGGGGEGGDDGGCSTGSGTSGLALGLLALVIRRRRRA
jgi:uncharacterized protein (TIGR03382 family)